MKRQRFFNLIFIFTITSFAISSTCISAYTKDDLEKYRTRSSILSSISNIYKICWPDDSSYNHITNTLEIPEKVLSAALEKNQTILSNIINLITTARNFETIASSFSRQMTKQFTDCDDHMIYFDNKTTASLAIISGIIKVLFNNLLNKALLKTIDSRIKRRFLRTILKSFTEVATVSLVAYYMLKNALIFDVNTQNKLQLRNEILFLETALQLNEKLKLFFKQLIYNGLIEWYGEIIAKKLDTTEQKSIPNETLHEDVELRKEVFPSPTMPIQNIG